jgi:hypothetical protein
MVVLVDPHRWFQLMVSWASIDRSADFSWWWLPQVMSDVLARMRWASRRKTWRYRSRCSGDRPLSARHHGKVRVFSDRIEQPTTDLRVLIVFLNLIERFKLVISRINVEAPLVPPISKYKIISFMATRLSLTGCLLWISKVREMFLILMPNIERPMIWIPLICGPAG